MNLIASTLGLFLPQHRTLSAWASEYQKILDAKPLKPKTHNDRTMHARRVVEGLGADTRLCTVRPSQIATLIKEAHQHSPNSSRKMLQEARSFFDTAIIEGWIDKNPAAPIKPLPAPVQRKRLTLSEWQKLYEWSQSKNCPSEWAKHMLLLAISTGQRRADLQKMQFADVRDGMLYIEQQKTGSRIALPIKLKLDAIGVSIEDVINECKTYAPNGPNLLRKSTGDALCTGSLSAVFRDAYVGVHGREWNRTGTPPSLHECRSLSERLYRNQGINTQILLGHARQSMTDQYNNDRGLTKGVWKVLDLP